MGYIGTTASIPLGQAGLQVDDPMSQIAPSAAIKANNISLVSSRVEKSRGSSRYNNVGLGSPIVGLFDWWPTATQQRLIAATANGGVFRDAGNSWGGFAMVNTEIQTLRFTTGTNTPLTGEPTAGSVNLVYNGVAINLEAPDTALNLQTEIRGAFIGMGSAVVTGTFKDGFKITFVGTTGPQNMITSNYTGVTQLAIGGTPINTTVERSSVGKLTFGVLTPDVQFVAGGNEVTANPKKLFFFSGTSQIQVLEADGSVLRDIAKPAADWASGNYPTFGLIYQSRLIAISKHRIYISALGDHEDFQSVGTGADFFAKSQQYPIFAGEGDAIMGGIVYKGSLILYKKPSGLYIFNWQDTAQAPTITRYTDAFAAASPHAATIVQDDLIIGSSSGSLTSLKATNAYGSLEQGDVLSSVRVRDYIRGEFDPTGAAFMHSLYYTEKEVAYFTGRNSPPSPQNRMINMDVSRQSARITLETKDQPTCLASRRDQYGILRPIYGANDGYVYLMDQVTRNVANLPYVGEFQTPYIDFSYMDASLADKTKLFDFLSLTYQGIGSWNFYVDVYVDGNFKETVTYRQKQGASLGSFVLNVSKLGGINNVTQRNPLHCSGKSISFRIYNNNVNEYFRVERCAVGFRIGGEQEMVRG